MRKSEQHFRLSVEAVLQYIGCRLIEAFDVRYLCWQRRGSLVITTK